LALHRSDAGVHEEQPIVYFIPLSRAPGKADLVFRVIPIYQVLHNASRLEEINGLAISESVGQGGNSTIGVDGAEPRLLLCVFADVDFVNFVGKASNEVSG
jgi:hypothetical protein